MCQSPLGSWKTKGMLHGRALTVLLLQEDGAPCQRLGRDLGVLEGFMPSLSGNRENIPTLHSPSFFPIFPKEHHCFTNTSCKNTWESVASSQADG